MPGEAEHMVGADDAPDEPHRLTAPHHALPSNGDMTSFRPESGVGGSAADAATAGGASASFAAGCGAALPGDHGPLTSGAADLPPAVLAGAGLATAAPGAAPPSKPAPSNVRSRDNSQPLLSEQFIALSRSVMPQVRVRCGRDEKCIKENGHRGRCSLQLKPREEDMSKLVEQLRSLQAELVSTKNDRDRLQNETATLWNKLMRVCSTLSNVIRLRLPGSRGSSSLSNDECRNELRAIAQDKLMSELAEKEAQFKTFVGTFDAADSTAPPEKAAERRAELEAYTRRHEKEMASIRQMHEERNDAAANEVLPYVVSAQSSRLFGWGSSGAQSSAPGITPMCTSGSRMPYSGGGTCPQQTLVSAGSSAARLGGGGGASGASSAGVQQAWLQPMPGRQMHNQMMGMPMMNPLMGGFGMMGNPMMTPLMLQQAQFAQQQAFAQQAYSQAFSAALASQSATRMPQSRLDGGAKPDA